MMICTDECTDDDKRSYRNVCNMSFVSFSLAVIFIMRLFSTSAFRAHKTYLKQKYKTDKIYLDYYIIPEFRCLKMLINKYAGISIRDYALQTDTNNSA